MGNNTWEIIRFLLYMVISGCKIQSYTVHCFSRSWKSKLSWNHHHSCPGSLLCGIGTEDHVLESSTPVEWPYLMPLPYPPPLVCSARLREVAWSLQIIGCPSKLRWLYFLKASNASSLYLNTTSATPGAAITTVSRDPTAPQSSWVVRENKE